MIMGLNVKHRPSVLTVVSPRSRTPALASLLDVFTDKTHCEANHSLARLVNCRNVRGEVRSLVASNVYIRVKEQRKKERKSTDGQMGNRCALNEFTAHGSRNNRMQMSVAEAKRTRLHPLPPGGMVNRLLPPPVTCHVLYFRPDLRNRSIQWVSRPAIYVSNVGLYRN